MALLPPAVSAAVLTFLPGSNVKGIAVPQLAQAVGVGFAGYITSSVTVVTQDGGSAGAGAGFGQGLTVSSLTFTKSFKSAFPANGLDGAMSEPLILALSKALSVSLLAANFITVHAGTGTGTGSIVRVRPVPPSSRLNMISAFFGAGLVGSGSRSLASAIAQGVDQALTTGTGQVVITGSASPSPGGGFGSGKIV